MFVYYLTFILRGPAIKIYKEIYSERRNEATGPEVKHMKGQKLKIL